ncbi:N-acetylmuramoyl-L-alanine amidase [Streptomyces tricolor]|nr:N-acetylmuramoyl-L-alanine amidase [Streptomyces tricolor]
MIAEKGLPPDNEANTDGNRHFYGFECENLGDGEDPWPEEQLEAIEAGRRGTVPAPRVDGTVGHRPPGWQPGKVDPRGFTMSSMRERVRERLKD